jgi:hypothetical protein
MVIRPTSRSDETHIATEAVNTFERDAAEGNPIWVAEPVDLRFTNPFRLIARAVGPALLAVPVTMILFAVMPSQPPLDPIAGRAVPVSVVAAGSVLTKTDSITRSGNYTIQFAAQSQSTLMLVWDYAAEDGDMVSVLVNGAPMGESFTIMHAAKVVRVPTGSDVSVIGTRDGGGGITYAVNFPDAQRTVVNGIQTGEMNRYVLQLPTSSALPR